MSIRINSETDCILAYKNHCNGTVKLSDEELGQIYDKWQARIPAWNEMLSDENGYEFDDSEFESFVNSGRLAAQEASGHDGKAGGVAARDGIEAAASVAGGVVSVAGGGVGSAIANTGHLANQTKSIFKTGEKVAKNTGKAAGGSNWLPYLAAAIAIATAASYRIDKPNKDEKAASDVYMNEVMGAQAAVYEQQEEMAYIEEQVISLGEEAEAYNEQANEQIITSKTQFDLYRLSYEALKVKIDNGQPLTESEAALFRELTAGLTTKGDEINSTSSETTDVVSQIYDDMGTYQDGLNYAAETFGEAQGLVEEALNLQKSTQNLCYVEAGSQGANAVSAAITGSSLMSGGWWNWALAFATLGAGVSSGFAAAEQKDWAGQVGVGITNSEATADISVAAVEDYSVKVENYDTMIEAVEGLEMQIPDDLAVPEDTVTPIVEDPRKKNDKNNLA